MKSDIVKYLENNYGVSVVTDKSENIKSNGIIAAYTQLAGLKIYKLSLLRYAPATGVTLNESSISIGIGNPDNTLMAHVDATEGEVLIDGINVKDLSFNDLRKNIAMVSQDTYLFMGTVAENIAYADENVSRDKIIEAAKLAGLKELPAEITAFSKDEEIVYIVHSNLKRTVISSAYP